MCQLPFCTRCDAAPVSSGHSSTEQSPLVAPRRPSRPLHISEDSPGAVNVAPLRALATIELVKENYRWGFKTHNAVDRLVVSEVTTTGAQVAGMQCKDTIMTVNGVRVVSKQGLGLALEAQTRAIFVVERDSVEAAAPQVRRPCSIRSVCLADGPSSSMHHRCPLPAPTEPMGPPACPYTIAVCIPVAPSQEAGAELGEDVADDETLAPDAGNDDAGDDDDAPDSDGVNSLLDSPVAPSVAAAPLPTLALPGESPINTPMPFSQHHWSAPPMRTHGPLAIVAPTPLLIAQDPPPIPPLGAKLALLGSQMPGDVIPIDSRTSSFAAYASMVTSNEQCTLAHAVYLQHKYFLSDDFSEGELYVWVTLTRYDQGGALLQVWLRHKLMSTAMLASMKRQLRNELPQSAAVFFGPPLGTEASTMHLLLRGDQCTMTDFQTMREMGPLYGQNVCVLRRPTWQAGEFGGSNRHHPNAMGHPRALEPRFAACKSALCASAYAGIIAWYTMDVKCQERWASAYAQASFSLDLKAAMVHELHVCRGMVIHMVECFELLGGSTSGIPQLDRNLQRGATFPIEPFESAADIYDELREFLVHLETIRGVSDLENRCSDYETQDHRNWHCRPSVDGMTANEYKVSTIPT